MLSLVLLVSLGIPAAAADDAAARLRSICEKVAAAPSATFEVSLHLLVDGVSSADLKQPFDAKARSGKAKDQTLVVRHETGKPEHLTLDGAELYRFADGVLVGRVEGGAWRQIEGAVKPDLPYRFFADGRSTALDRLAYAAGMIPHPGDWLTRASGAIGEADEKTTPVGPKLEAWINGYGPDRAMKSTSDDPPRPDTADDATIAAILRPDGGVERLEVTRYYRSSTYGGFERHSITPKAVGETRVTVPDEVAKLGASGPDRRPGR